MDASCGPSNALSQFSKHTQRDTSLQHEQHHFPQNGQNAFRNRPVVDANLNSDFHRFNQENSVDFQPQMFHVQPMANNMKTNTNENPGFQRESGPGWVQDFRGLSLENQGSHQVHNRVQNVGPKSDWHRQFMQNMQSQNFSTGQQNVQSQPQYNMHQMRENLGQQQNYQQNYQQQQNHVEIDEQALSKQFDMIEQELEQVQAQAQASAQQSNLEQMTIGNEAEKEQFAAAARQVQNSMTTGNVQQSQETAAKFQQSGFLKLMTQISDRQVEISNDGEKLVSKSTGEDIRQYLSDPLKHEREAETETEADPEYQTPLKEFVTHGSGSVPESRATNESANIRSHLPDPLAHIRDGALDGNLSSLQAAQVISGGQVQGDSWMEDGMYDSMDQTSQRLRPSILSAYEQEVYDDYRNDDY